MIGIGFVGLAALWLLGAWFSYRIPAFFPVTRHESKIPGTAYIETLLTITTDMTNPWLPNDIFFWPTRMLDNPQHFQLGELEVVRHATRVLRDHFARRRTTDAIDQDADRAYTAFSNDPRVLLWPRAEWKYEEGIEALGRYQVRLIAGEALFRIGADNLKDCLVQFISLLGGASQRLANAPRDIKLRISEETAEDRVGAGEKRIRHQTPWMRIDDNFYYVRGELYALAHLMAAIEYDFMEDVLIKKNAHELMRAIVEILAFTQFDPIIVANGGVGSLLANHSLQLQARLEDARQKMRSLQSILEQ